MPKICSRCGRSKLTPKDQKTGVRRRASAHKCDLAKIVKVGHRDDDNPYVISVHSDRVEPGGDLYSKTRGKHPEFEVVERSHTRLEKSVERRKRSGSGKQKLKTRRQKERESKASEEE